MDVIVLLKDSLVLLVRQPKVFLPKLFTTFLYSIYAIATIKIALEMVVSPQSVDLTLALLKLIVLLAFTYILYLVDIFTYAMYPKIVDDYSHGRKISLVKSLKNAISVWKVLIALSIFLFIFLILSTLIYGIVNLVGLLVKSILVVYLGIGVMILITLVFAILMFFTVPVCVLERTSLTKSIRKSIRLGLTHKSLLVKVNLVFMVLVFITLWLVASAELREETDMVAILLFLSIRLIQAVLNTYLNVSNPYIYLAIKQSKDINKKEV